MRPRREHATNNGQTYFVTSSTFQKRSLFQNPKWCELFVQNLFGYRGKYFELHEFVVMWDHFHLLITPTGALERAVQTIKGGFSYKAKKEFGTNQEFWQVGFGDHRIRDAQDYQIHRLYIFNNPVKKGYCARPQDYPWSSGSGKFELDAPPQRLKPLALSAAAGAHECAPLQSKSEEWKG
jgi:putative transposase